MKDMYRYVLFDLDGTLTDPKEGICKSVQFALEAQGIHEPNLDKLEPFIGPPLKDSFREFYQMNEEQCEEGVKTYRQRFSTIGLFENEIYPGMKNLLEELKKKNIHMAIASSKPEVFVEKILKHFEIDSYFEVITGCDINGKKVDKIDVMEEAIAKLLQMPIEAVKNAIENPDSQRVLPLDDILMVGDRKFDVLGAKHFHVDSIGVYYGYAPDGELEDAGATYITDDLEEIYCIITGEKFPRKEYQMNSFKRSVHMVLPLVYSYAISIVVIFVLQWIVRILFAGPLKNHALFLIDYSSQIAVCVDAFASLVCGIVGYSIYKKEKKQHISKIIKRRFNKELLKGSIFIVASGASLGLFFNLLLSYLQIINQSDSYQKVANLQYSIPIVLGLIIYGLVKPFEEEIIFRGLLYGRIRLFFPRSIAILVSALIFGASHGNKVQLIYAFVMGCVLAWIYDTFRSIKASFLFHSSANVLIYLISMYSLIDENSISISGMIVAGIVASVCLAFLVGQKYWGKKYGRSNTSKTN